MEWPFQRLVWAAHHFRGSLLIPNISGLATDVINLFLWQTKIAGVNALKVESSCTRAHISQAWTWRRDEISVFSLQGPVRER